VSVLTEIAAATRQVISSGNLSEAWQYRQRTSAPTAASPTYGAWTAMQALPTGKRYEEAYDDAREAITRQEAISLRISDTGPALKAGDQVRDAANVTWAVEAQESGAGGTMRFRCVRDIPNKQTPNRNGGLL
jgi:hypothetical protein